MRQGVPAAELLLVRRLMIILKFALVLLLPFLFILLGIRLDAPSYLIARLLPLFIAGTVFLIFVKGPTYGTIDPISTRPLMVLLGFLMMVVPTLFVFLLKGAGRVVR